VQNTNFNLDDLVAGGLSGTMLGYPAWEDTAMVNTITTGSKILAMRDFRLFCIVDRIGMDIEIVSHLMGSNQRPTGQRAIYCMWRNTSKVLDPAAFRVLVAG
jgi:HK97 family phage major capsid protein